MFRDPASVIDCVERGFYGRKILVVGDLVLDRHVWGKVSRISPEGPVPVVEVISRSETAGGAGNAALNVAELGLRVGVCGLIGDDSDGERLRDLLEAVGVETSGTVSGHRRTTTKTRIIGGHQQMLRLDEEDASNATPEECRRLLEAIKTELSPEVAALILSDYGKGALSDEVCRAAIQMARQIGLPVYVDPKGTNYAKYAGATAVKPNQAEIGLVEDVRSESLEDVVAAGRSMLKRLDLEFVLVTLGERGMLLVQEDSVQEMPALARDVFDVTGAGDTVIATLASARAAGLELGDAVRLANLAAGAVVGKAGTEPVKRKELLDAISLGQALQLSDKICTLDMLLARVDKWRARGEAVGFTNGCFDVLHSGHVTLLEKARQQADRLVVGLNSDRSVKRLKGDSRPIIPQDKRALVLAALASVDAVVLFDGDTPIDLITAIRPDVLVKGSDYRDDQVVGAAEVRSWGGQVVLVPLVQGQSTSGIVSKIAERAGAGD